MNRYPKISEIVKVIRYLGAEFEDDKIGKVIWRDGEYILIKLKKSGIEVECYTCELEEI